MHKLPRIDYWIKKKILTYKSSVGSMSFILSYILIVSACCILLTAYCLLSACGKKGPPTLKSDNIAPPPAQSESVDSNNVETITGKSSTEN